MRFQAQIAAAQSVSLTNSVPEKCWRVWS